MPDTNIIIDSHSYPSSIDDYYEIVTKKKNIVLHSTAGGSLTGAVEALAKEDHVAVHFIIDKDGGIYQFYPVKYWAFHMGIKNTGGRHDKTSVSVEIVNVGPLQLRGNNLCFWPNNFNAKYCSLDQTDKYIPLPHPWRGFSYFASYTNEQYDSAAKLCAYICEIEKINPVVLSSVNEFQLDNIDSFNGIYTHTSVRVDKYDVGYGWQWQTFKEYLEEYTQAIKGTNPKVPWIEE